ncbi:MAG: alanine racemase [Lactobacillaceae bacterium]|nr:alanine racemase [Lactobacillaceae bacterium]
MIYGNGIDAQEISAVEGTASRQPRFIDTILTANERAIFDSRKGKHQWEFLAGRFSLKEAYSKAIGTGIGKAVSWHDLEILYDAKGAPLMTKHPKQATLLAHVSISHTGDSVHTSVILEDLPTLTQPVSTHRPAWIEISAAALKHNIQYIKTKAQAERFFAVVKANAYGHGLPQVITAALEVGVEGFAVATMDEALWVRSFGVKQPILILGITAPEYANELASNQLTPVVTSLASLQALVDHLTVNQQLSVAIGVDTGMGRIGMRDQAEIKATLALIKTHAEQIQLQSIGMHFATADEKDNHYFEQQLQRWHTLIDDLDLPADVWLHVANSATSLWHSNPATDVIRVGAGMYGFDASNGAMPATDLQPVLSLKADLVAVKQIAPGDSVSYGATYTATQPTWIGTLPIGYADGYPRALQGMYGLLPTGEHVEIVGRIAMDQLMVALPHEYPVGTTITLIGQVGAETITLVDLAQRVGTIPYEIATGLATRLPRNLIN